MNNYLFLTVTTKDKSAIIQYVPEVPRFRQSTPNVGLFSANCAALILAKAFTGERPEFSASAIGTASSASANARKAYCSKVLILLAFSAQARAQEISGAPPPYKIFSFLITLRTVHNASWIARFASSMI